MAKIGGIPSTSFRIWESPEEGDRKRLAPGTSGFARTNDRVDDNRVGGSADKKLQKMTKFPRRSKSKDNAASEAAKKTPENVRIPLEVPQAPVKPRRAPKKLNGVPKMLQYPEAEDENVETVDSGYEQSQTTVNHRYSTRLSLQRETWRNKVQSKNLNTKPKAKSKKEPKDLDKENDVNSANGLQPSQGTCLSKRSSKPKTNLPASKNLDTPEEKNTPKRNGSFCSSDDWREHLRWLQPRRDIGVWIECCRKKCRKWRYVEKYHDPSKVPKVWYCEMNEDLRFAKCEIPQQELPPDEDQIMNAYNAGSIVWARINGYPWWPAVVDDCPDALRYWETRNGSNVPYKYHVTFFDEKVVERTWVPLKDLKSYEQNPRDTFLKKTTFRRKNYSKQLDVACKLADEAVPLTISERLERFSYVARTHGYVSSLTAPKKRPASTDRTTHGYVSSLTAPKKRPASKDRTTHVRSRLINTDLDTSVNLRESPSKVTDQSTNNECATEEGTSTVTVPYDTDDVVILTPPTTAPTRKLGPKRSIGRQRTRINVTTRDDPDVELAIYEFEPNKTQFLEDYNYMQRSGASLSMKTFSGPNAGQRQSSLAEKRVARSMEVGNNSSEGFSAEELMLHPRKRSREFFDRSSFASSCGAASFATYRGAAIPMEDRRNSSTGFSADEFEPRSGRSGFGAC